MIPEYFYSQNLRLIDKHVSQLHGDVIECGVWRGGMIAGISEILGRKRSYHLCDSFEGLPAAKAIDGEAALAWQQNTEGDFFFDNCTADESFARRAMQMTHADFQLHKGWFRDTLPGLQIQNGIAVLRLDGDWYDSTMDCLRYLYPQVRKNGLILIDDYYTWDGCSRAVHDYLASISSISRIAMSNGVCYIQKLDD